MTLGPGKDSVVPGPKGEIGPSGSINEENKKNLIWCADGICRNSDKNTIAFTNNWKALPRSDNNMSEISNDINDYKKLMLVGNRSAGGDREVGIWDNLLVDKNLTVRNNTKTNTLEINKLDFKDWELYQEGDSLRLRNKIHNIAYDFHGTPANKTNAALWVNWTPQ